MKQSKVNREAMAAGTGTHDCKVSLGLEVDMNESI